MSAGPRFSVVLDASSGGDKCVSVRRCSPCQPRPPPTPSPPCGCSHERPTEGTPHVYAQLQHSIHDGSSRYRHLPRGLHRLRYGARATSSRAWEHCEVSAHLNYTRSHQPSLKQGSSHSCNPCCGSSLSLDIATHIYLFTHSCNLIVCLI